ncbi:T9SS type B sorting domain-containing protein [Flavobacterium sp. W1B]|uniref:T9SS type B sorting domain-containing protein n=1 Tax=Flavobacterium sp. W1B TaxID=3394146 RepID=UPI0039BD2C48
MKKKLLIIFTFLSISCFAQFSKTHYIPPLTCTSNLAADQYIYISTPSTINVNFKIIAIGGNTITGTVNNNAPYRHTIGQGSNTQLLTPKNTIGILTNKGFVVEAEDLIYVSVRVNSALNQEGTYNHAGGLVSKGNSALGNTFRLGAMLNPLFDSTLLNFASILSTENGTKITISNIPNGTILSDGSTINGPIIVTLNKNESYVLAMDNNTNTTPSNSSKMIGALVESDKPVVVNSGSFGGSNSTLVGRLQDGSTGPTGRDVGFDQIVSFDKTGKEYIFIKGNGTDELERVLLIAHKNNTKIYTNGNPTPISTLNAGEFIALDGSQFSNGNLYVTSSENIFAYQSIGGTLSPANQNLFFVPPINCATPNTVNNIPFINLIGTTSFTGSINVVTEIGATVLINDNPITADPISINGNASFAYYTVSGLSGNVSIKSTKQVYVSYFGTNGAATYGGYYSGFDTKPEIVSDKISLNSSSCIPNITLKINSLSSYDTFQWYFNDIPITGANLNSYTPTQAGYYQVKGSISGCGSTVFSDKIPVSNCPDDSDNDGVNNNIDIDLDNDGIINRYEAPHILINQSNPVLGSEYSGLINGSGNIVGNPLYGFVSEVPAGKDKTINYTLNFNQPEIVTFSYISQGNPNQTTAITDYLNSDGDFILRVPTDKTITVTDPNDQLLIDTNYDGIYESGVKEFSSFEIRFRLKNTVPLLPGTGSFKFQSYLTNSITFSHTNLSESNSNKATFGIEHFLMIDSDSDGIQNLLDIDSDNDGIPDTIEAQGKNPKIFSGIDSNKNGLDDAFEPGFIPIDTDQDQFPDYLDLDSDNDGIYDVTESGNDAIDADFDGKINGIPSSFGTNGLFDDLETNPDSGILKKPIADTDADGTFNYIDLDSDGDLCFDVIEAGFLDPDGDGLLGNSPITRNANGKVSSSLGYTTPNNNYIIAAPIVISTQPQAPPTCEFQNTTITLADNGGNSYQWQLSTDATTWNNITNNATYSGATTNTLSITNVKNAMNGYKYRVQLNKTGNSCGLISAETSLVINPLPNVNTTSIIQCDDNADGITDFNLTEKNSSISTNYSNESFTYYTTFSGANNSDSNFFINNPTAYSSANGIAWARVENENGCTKVAQLNLIVSTTQIPNTFTSSFSECDDFIDPINDDKDGVATFDFSSVTDDIKTNYLSSSTLYTIKYYRDEADALAESNEITNTTNYRNIGYPNQQRIWIRVESTLDNACYGLGPHITLTVNAKPNIDTNEDHSKDKLVCSNLPSFFVQLDAGINDGSPTNDYSYIWWKDDTIIAGETAPTINVNTEGTYKVEVSTRFGCSRIRTIKVTASDIAHIDSIIISDLTDINTVTVNISGQGNYEYSIDGANGPFQDSNFFDNVPSGIHDVFINDKNGCGTVSKTIAVIGAPKFFTPNGDGYNDYWNIKGVTANFNSKSIIYIFDRYGKLLKQINPSNQGWDGTFNGQPLPTDDYWYTVKLEDGREAKGHFSLKR